MLPAEGTTDASSRKPLCDEPVIDAVAPSMQLELSLRYLRSRRIDRENSWSPGIGLPTSCFPKGAVFMFMYSHREIAVGDTSVGSTPIGGLLHPDGAAAATITVLFQRRPSRRLNAVLKVGRSLRLERVAGEHLLHPLQISF
jgi:hypothetical protein